MATGEKQDNVFWFRFISFLLGAFTVGSLTLIFLYELRGADEVFSEKNMSYTDFSAVLLTTVAVIVGVMGVLMAFFAFFGFRLILDEARKSAVKEARKQIRFSLKKDGDLRSFIEESVSSIAREEMMKAPVGTPEEEGVKEEMDDQDEDEPEFEEPSQ